MRSGKMRYRLTVQRPSVNNEHARRGSRTEWETVHVGKPDGNGKIWAGIRQRRVAESQQKSNQLAVIGSYEIRLWLVPGIDETWRFVHEQSGTIYNITSIGRPSLNSRELVVMAKRDKLKA